MGRLRLSARNGPSRKAALAKVISQFDYCNVPTSDLRGGELERRVSRQVGAFQFDEIGEPKIS